MPPRLWNLMSLAKGTAADIVAEWRAEIVPPPSIRGFIGDRRGFLPRGYEFLEHFQNLGKLKPDDRVLDVGCGIGRMAIPMTKYLSPATSYDGVDIVPLGIEWCKDNITPRYPNFRFHLADVYNQVYNPSGRLRVVDFRFPFQDASFDFVFLTSVFTHMFEADVRHYLAEIARVLAPGGRCLITWFLLNDESRERARSGKSEVTFSYPVGGGMVTNETIPEEAIAFDEAKVAELYRSCLLNLTPPIYGSWSGRPHAATFQDICVATKA